MRDLFKDPVLPPAPFGTVVESEPSKQVKLSLAELGWSAQFLTSVFRSMSFEGGMKGGASFGLRESAASLFQFTCTGA